MVVKLSIRINHKDTSEAWLATWFYHVLNSLNINFSSRRIFSACPLIFGFRWVSFDPRELSTGWGFPVAASSGVCASERRDWTTEERVAGIKLVWWRGGRKNCDFQGKGTSPSALETDRSLTRPTFYVRRGPPVAGNFWIYPMLAIMAQAKTTTRPVVGETRTGNVTFIYFI